MVEGITFPNGDYLIINEEGKIMGLPLNKEATNCGEQLSQKISMHLDTMTFVVGPAILIKKDALKIWASINL